MNHKEGGPGECENAASSSLGKEQFLLQRDKDRKCLDIMVV